MVTAVFYLGEAHPLLVGRTVVISPQPNGMEDANLPPVITTDAGTSEFIEVELARNQRYLISVTPEFVCDFDEELVFGWVFFAFVREYEYAGEHNRPRLLFVCEDVEESSNSSLSVSTISSMSSLSSMSSTLSEASSMSSGSSGLN